MVDSVSPGQLAQLVRAFGSHPRGHWFESSIAQICKNMIVVVKKMLLRDFTIKPHKTVKINGKINKNAFESVMR